MAPPQNSTLINDDIESIASELSRLSPIYNSSASSNNMDDEKVLGYIDVNRPQKSESEYEEEEDEEYDEDEEEIPIWIGKEPRFISGITATTTCKQLIQALIEDELANGKYVDSGASRDIDDYQITENWRDVEQVLENDTLILGLWQAWGNMKNEVQFRLKINKYNSRNRGRDSKKSTRSSKSEKIGVINKLLKKIIRQGEVIQSHLGQISEKNVDRRNREKLKSYFKSKKGKQMIMENFLQDSSILSIATDSFEKINPTKFENEHFFAKYHKYSTLPRNFSNQSKKPNIQDLIDPKWNFNRNNVQTTEDEDEIFLVIENKNMVTSDNDSGVFIAKKPDSRVTISETPRRKLRTAKNYADVKNHLINQTHANKVTPQEFSRASFRFDQLRQEIRKKMEEMEQLLQQEKTLLHKIHEKTLHYNNENSLYNSNTNFLNFDIEIDEIQRKLQDCANDIILDEKELFTIKVKVEETSKTLDYLKGVMDRQCVGGYNEENYDHISSYTFKENQIQFVNNFDEFCDNNESIVV